MILKCLECGNEYSVYTTNCRNKCNALLRSIYNTGEDFKPAEQEKSLFKFLQWLPCSKPVRTTIGPVVYKCDGFAQKLSLSNLYIAFNGYWPEKDAGNMTGTWKDYEALPTMQCFLENGMNRIILASAGNTARAFAYAATQVDVETYIVVPENSLERLWLPSELDTSRIHLIAVRNSWDYYKAITVSAGISRQYDIPIEAGAKNVARRDGMGTVMLEAARVIGALPKYYFQAVGSGTGGIANFESSLKLLSFRQFQRQPVPRLNLVQNSPFSPMYNAWQSGSDIDPHKNVETQVQQIGEIYANVLANRNPPYNIKGGVRDVLNESGGQMHVVSNREAIEAGLLFEETEGIDISPAASVCAAALIKNATQGRVNRDEVILMNVTGGGTRRLQADRNCIPLVPEIVIEDENDPELKRLF